MATSPNPNQTLTTPKKKDESFLDKLGGTLGRKKKAKEGMHGTYLTEKMQSKTSNILSISVGVSQEFMF